ncbi:MAG: DUF2384 domain-containing protein [Gammaproteobacteria bacterium]|nr:DUF2384 domain-containing protein [Gammaproteobacteria bacterium]
MNDQQWNDYASLFLQEWKSSDINDQLLGVVGDKLLASVIAFHFGKDALHWLDRPVDALGGRKPRECLSTTNGIKDLKEILMRMH